MATCVFGHELPDGSVRCPVCGLGALPSTAADPAAPAPAPTQTMTAPPVPPWVPPQPQPFPTTAPWQPASQGTNGLAVASLVLGIVWLAGIGSVLAVIFGHVGRGQIKRTGEQGGGLAIAGTVLGYVGIAFAALFLIAAAMPNHHRTGASVFSPITTTSSRGYDASVKSDLRTVANGMETYFTDNQVYPTSSDVSGTSGTVTIGSYPATLSAGDVVVIAQSGREGFCLVGSNPRATQTWYYDSLNGGITTQDCSSGSGY